MISARQRLKGATGDNIPSQTTKHFNIRNIDDRKRFFTNYLNQTKGGIQERKPASDVHKEKRHEERSNEQPKASLLKYEVRKLVSLKKTNSQSQEGHVETEIGIDFKNLSSNNNNNNNNNNNISIGSKKNNLTKMNGTEGYCCYCNEYKQKIRELEKKCISDDNLNNNGKIQMEDLLKERDKLLQALKAEKALSSRLQNELNTNANEQTANSKKLKTSQQNLTKLQNQVEDEEIQNRRLTIKLEDANYEIGRLRTELINTQIESEKIVEENEDLAVDNEDLMKERDEILQIYDELFRESERLKHEVHIWKTVFEQHNNNDDVEEVNEALENEKRAGEEMEDAESSEDEGLEADISEDPSLLLPPHDDIMVKSIDPTKVFDIIDEISRGKFGKVYKTIEKRTSHLYTAKYIKVTPKLRHDVLATIEIMKKMHHVRLMNLFDVYDLGSQIVMILEYVGGGMLFERIVERNSLTENDCVVYMKQILQGLYHLHSKQICHLEIRPENIVCVNKQNMDIKIIDFGLAKQLEPKKEVKIAAGSPEFVAPEILSFDPVSLASDMWSVGVIAYVMLSGISPFIGDDDNDTLMNVSCGEYDFNKEAFDHISSDAKDFISALLLSHPKKRAKASKALTHNWMKISKDKQTRILLDNMKVFLGKRKDMHTVSAVRAIRRFSSFGAAGHAQGLLAPRPNPLSAARKTSPMSSRNLIVPSYLPAPTIMEGDEEEERNSSTTYEVPSSCPTIKVTNGDDDDENCDPVIEVHEDTNTPEGLRMYLQRMINQGHLPGSQGPFTAEVEHSEEEEGY